MMPASASRSAAQIVKILEWEGQTKHIAGNREENFPPSKLKFKEIQGGDIRCFIKAARGRLISNLKKQLVKSGG